MRCPSRFPSKKPQPPFRCPRQPGNARKTAKPSLSGLVQIIFCLCLLLPCSLFGQQSGAINGAVTDPGGGAIANAQVTVTNTAQGTALKATTNSAGEYSVPALEAGTYSLQVTAPGFQKFEATGIVLRVARTERVDAKLAVGYLAVSNQGAPLSSWVSSSTVV